MIRRVLTVVLATAALTMTGGAAAQAHHRGHPFAGHSASFHCHYVKPGIWTNAYWSCHTGHTH
jgi:hypothetical protein